MSNANSRRANSTLGIVLLTFVILACAPATLYGALWSFSKIVPPQTARSLPPMITLQNFFAMCWFIVVLAGRPLCAIALILDAVLVLWRGPSILQKLLASLFLVFAVLGTILIESQVRAIRR
ncbi:MAG: hypothetical protein WAN14_06625 [Candidatus Acidiferrales bacterium]